MAKKIKILLTIPNFDTAGSGKVLYDLAKGLDKERFEVSIACKNNKGDFFREVESLGIPVYFIDPTVPLRPYYLLPKRLGVFRKFVKEHEFDIVHSWHWSSDWTEAFATRLAGSKFVYTKKAMTWGNIHWKIRSFISSFIITLNDEMHTYFPYKKNQKLIPLGIDTAYYNDVSIHRISQDEIFKVITVANLVPVKNVEVLIQAIHLLNDAKIRVDIIGDNTTSYANELMELVRELKLEDQIRFLGKQSDVRPFLANADLYVISSKKEGMPMALVEAMTMGVPVLGSNISGVKFVLKDYENLIFDPSDPTILSKKIDAFCHETKEVRDRLGDELRKYANENFSLSRFIKAHEDLYCKLNSK